MSEWEERLRKSLLELGRAGCQGSPEDYNCWVRYAYEESETSAQDLSALLEKMSSEGLFEKHPDIPSEWRITEKIAFNEHVTYKVSGNLEYNPLQMVRSRLESFLRFHGATEEDLIDVSIGTTEAMENAVKYSDHKDIDVNYEIENGVFQIRIVNRIGEIQLDKDIESGKYSGSLTLMRGMMVMVKLFDEMDIDISEEQHLAIFKAHKKLGHN